MPAFRDLTKETFEGFVVQTLSHRHNQKIYYKCLCNCRKEFVTVASDLTSGHTKSCGCLRKEITQRMGKTNKKPPKKDITGQRYNYLVVKCYTGMRNKSRDSIWECYCDCGNITEVCLSSLQSGHTMSCGKCHIQSNLHKQTKEALINLGYEIEYEEFPVHQQYFSFDDRVSILRVDLVIGTPKGLVAIECNGQQHYNPVKWFGGEEAFRRTQERDRLKKRSLDALGFPLITVRYDCKDIEAFLKEQLHGVTTS